MARLLIYDAYENKVYTYNSLNENDPMPYSTERTLTLREFRGKSGSPVLWTTIAAMEAWNLTRRKYGKGIPVGYAFRRIWEGGHGTRSQHYAGVAFDVGQRLTQSQRTAIYKAARSTGAWGYVEPLSQTPTWVHFDRRYGTPACSGTTAGYPTLRRGSRGCYVMILQDALSTLGYQTGSRIDGLFGTRPEGLPAPHQPDGGRRVRLQQLEKDHNCSDRHGQNKNDDRLRNRKKLRREGGASLQSVAKPLSHASRDSPPNSGALGMA